MTTTVSCCPSVCSTSNKIQVFLRVDQHRQQQLTTAPHTEAADKNIKPWKRSLQVCPNSLPPTYK